LSRGQVGNSFRPVLRLTFEGQTQAGPPLQKTTTLTKRRLNRAPVSAWPARSSSLKRGIQSKASRVAPLAVWPLSPSNSSCV